LERDDDVLSDWLIRRHMRRRLRSDSDVMRLLLAFNTNGAPRLKRLPTISCSRSSRAPDVPGRRAGSHHFRRAGGTDGLRLRSDRHSGRDPVRILMSAATDGRMARLATRSAYLLPALEI